MGLSVPIPQYTTLEKVYYVEKLCTALYLFPLKEITGFFLNIKRLKII